MFPVEISLSRINAALAEIRRISRTDFPYEDSREALAAIAKMLEQSRQRFATLDLQDNDEIAQAICRESLQFFFEYLELVGLVLRSTDPRNNFEVYGALKRLFRAALKKDDVKLILSSEWSYSPMIYRDVDDLNGFVFVGFPTTEANNPLLLPLAGHELGHAVWKQFGIDLSLKMAVANAVTARFLQDKDKLANFYPDVIPLDLLTDLGMKIQDTALEKMEEYFCDLLGLKMFGESFLCAFGYLLAPGLIHASASYPSMHDRITALTDAAKKFGYDVPVCFESAFHEPKSSESPSSAMTMDWADDIAWGFLPQLTESAERIVADAGISSRTRQEVDRIKESFALRVPTTAKSLADILNAAWERALSLWAEQVKGAERSQIQVAPEITELTLKSIEIMEIQTVLDTHAT